MEYISSDTNIWLDFAVIDKLDLPFRLPYIYLMDKDAIEDELLNPPDIRYACRKENCRGGWNNCYICQSFQRKSVFPTRKITMHGRDMHTVF